MTSEWKAKEIANRMNGGEIMDAKKQVFGQIGVTALRAPDGTFLPSVPLYAKVAQKHVDADGKYTGEDPDLKDVAEIFADKFRQYAKANKAAAGA